MFFLYPFPMEISFYWFLTYHVIRLERKLILCWFANNKCVLDCKKKGKKCQIGYSKVPIDDFD